MEGYTTRVHFILCYIGIQCDEITFYCRGLLGSNVAGK